MHTFSGLRSSRRSHNPRWPTIGIVMRGFVLSDHDIWLGAAEAAASHDFNVVTFAGRALRSPVDFQAQSNVIYDLIDTSWLDGLVVLTSGLGLYVGRRGVRDFISDLGDLPVVSLQMALPDVPSILVDDYQGMRAVVDHLIEVHQRRRIAFIRGPVMHRGAEERYRAYVESLADHGLQPDPALISQPSKRWSNRAGIADFLSAFEPHAGEIDALVGASAGLVQQALSVLRGRGTQVPADVAVAGFDDFPFAHTTVPPMTTARVPFDAMGRRAVAMLAAQIRGESVEPRVTLPAQLMVRQSCGCPSRSVGRARLLSSESRSELSHDEALRVRDGEVSNDVTLAASIKDWARDHIPSLNAETLIWVDELVEALASDVRDLSTAPHPVTPSNSRFLQQLDRTLCYLANQKWDVAGFQDLISLARRSVLTIMPEDDGHFTPGQVRTMQALEDLFGQARVMAGEMAQTVASAAEMNANRQIVALNRISHNLTTAVDLEDMLDTLAESLPEIGIQGCYLVLYENSEDPTGWARLRFALASGRRLDVPPEGWRLSARDLLPFRVLQEIEGVEAPRHRVAEPLFIRDRHFGYIVMEVGPSELLFADQTSEGTGTAYDLLRGYLSDALHGIVLYEEARRARQQAEQANQLKSRFLSMVSHELRTPLNVVVSLSEMLLWEDDGHRKELERIHASAQHLDGLIRDVLDLASSQVGQLKLVREPLDLAQSLEVVTLIGEQMAQDKGLGWHADIPESLPRVWGDRTRIRQVALNLVSNAFRFTSEGEVRLRVEVEDQALRVLVSDTGIGVPVGEQETIFDEFQQSERTTARGYGGLGLGLAISRRLVEMHGGVMGVESSGVEGEGATFYFTVPLIAEDDVTCGVEMVTEEPDADSPVWVVSERTGAGERLRAYLTDRGYRVEEIRVNGRDGADRYEHWLARMARCRPSALILDLEPAQDRGWEMMKVIKENPDTRHIPVLFYSLLQDEASGSMLALDYLTKPVSIEDLTQTLQRQGLDAAEDDPDSEDAGASRAARGSGATFLVVDDEPDALAMHAWHLQSRMPKSRILRAASGKQALELMTRSRPDLVLLDLMMPEMTGFEVIERMRQHPDLCDIPVVVLTAKTLNQEVITRLNRGVATVLGKGLFSADETLQHVEAALRRSHQANLETRRIVRCAMAYIHEHYMESLTRQDVADHVGYSPRHLDRCFNDEMGLTPMAYLNRFRLRQARRLLQSTSRSIGEIADAVGFSNSAYFSRVFKQEMGASPSEYRRSL